MFNKPLVSILMTAYNREKFIAEAIESVIQSSYANWELIITDDCSSDSTLQIALNYSKKDNRIKVYKNGVNLGDYPNRNRAASYSCGEFIMFVDSDDMIYIDTIEKCVNIFSANKDASFGLYYPYTKDLIVLDPQQTIYSHFFNTPFLLMGPGGMIIRTEYFRKIGGFPTKYGPANDGYFNMKAASGTDTILLPFPLVFYRRHDGQELHNTYSYLYNRFLYLKDALVEIEMGLNEKQKKYINDKNCRRFIVNILKYQLNNWNLKKSTDAIKRANFTFGDALRGIFH